MRVWARRRGMDQAPLSALAGMDVTWLAAGGVMVTGWFTLVMVTVVVSETVVPSSTMVSFFTWCWLSSHALKDADLMPVVAISCWTAERLEAGIAAMALDIEMVPEYSVTGTPAMVLVPSSLTSVAPASSWLCV